MRRALALVFACAAALAMVLVVRALPRGAPDPPVPAQTPLPLDRGALAAHLGRALTFRTVSISAQTPPDLPELRALHAWLEETFPAVHRTLEREVVSEGSLLYRWAGSDPDLAPVLLMAHLDVVPVEPGTEARWTHPPFDGAVERGFVWGRGALDDKASLLGILEAAELLAETGFAPSRDLYLAFGHDEEVGGERGAAAIAARLGQRGVHLLFTLDEGMAIAGAGAFPGLVRDVAMVGTAEKGFLSLALTARAEGGHSSRPPERTAIGALARALAALEAHPFASDLVPPVSSMFDAVADDVSFPVRLALRNRWLFGPALRRLLARRPETDALIRTTAAPTILRAGVKDNVLPSEARAVVNFRIRPGDTVEGVVAHVRRAVADPGIELEVLEGREPTLPGPPGGDGFALLARTIRETQPGVAVVPALSIAGTDSKHYGAVADETLRFLPLRLTRPEAARIHGTDERIGVDAYVDVVRFYVRLLENAGAPRRPSPEAS
jgi:carboxypeptidase PM20D1